MEVGVGFETENTITVVSILYTYYILRHTFQYLFLNIACAQIQRSRVNIANFR